ncbi:MAG: NAD(P)H-dependent oxidoreductase [Pseudomonadota bacterium]
MNSIPTHTLLQALHWRYATKKFDPTKQIAATEWQALEEALVLSPSSVGLQPWKFLIVTDPAMKAKLVPAAWNQSQVADCSHFVVFAVHRNIGPDHVDRHLARMAEVRDVPAESLVKFRQMVTGNLDKARAEQRLDTWQTHQVYIALGQFMASAALLGIDTCPMEGFEPEKFDEILALKGTAYASVVCCAAGYRAADDKYAVTKKVRFKPDDVIVRI